MTINVRLKHSSVDAKVPLPGDLVDGELALNINANSPAAYIKDSAGTVIKLAGEGSVGSPDASETVKGVLEIATQTEVDAGADDARAVTPLKLATAVPAATETVAGKAEIATQAEADAGTNDATIVTPLKMATYVASNPPATPGPTPPVAPNTGDQYFDGDTLFLWDGATWVPAVPDLVKYTIQNDDTALVGVNLTAAINAALVTNGDIASAADLRVGEQTEIADSGNPDFNAEAPVGRYFWDGTEWFVAGGGGGGGGGTTKANIYGTAKASASVAADGTLNSGLNIQSVVKTGTGEYTAFFQNNMPNADYSVVLGSNTVNVRWTTKAVDSIVFQAQDTSSNPIDRDIDFTVHDDTPAEIIVGSGTVANTNIYGTAKAQASVLSGGTLQSGSRNIASVVRTGVGDYVINFTTPFSDTAYEVVVSQAAYQSFVSAKSVSSVRVRTFNNTNAAVDVDFDVVAFDNTPAEVALTTFGDVINYSGAAAWGYIDADGTIEGGLNVASVTETSPGNYQVTFSAPMPDSNYAVNATGNGASYYNCFVYSRSASGFQLGTRDASGTAGPSKFAFAVNALNALPPKGGTGTDAWGHFDRASGSLTASFNCTLVPNATGDLRITFDTPMPNANYSVTAAVSSAANALIRIRDKTANGFRITTGNVSDTFNSFVDCSVDFQVNATNATLPNSFSEEQIQSVVDLAQSGVTNPGASAWGYIDADGTIEGGLNVASVTETSPGNYQVTFSAPMANSNYAVNATGNGASYYDCFVYSRSASGFEVGTRDASGNAGSSKFAFTVFATNALPPKGGTGTDAWGSCANDGTLNSSFNVASVTRTATGEYDVVLASPMPTADYSVIATAQSVARKAAVGSKTVNGFTCYISENGNSTPQNASFDFAVNATNATLPATLTQDMIVMKAGDTMTGDLTVGSDSTVGVVLTSPGGTAYRLVVDDAGVLSTVTA